MLSIMIGDTLPIIAFEAYPKYLLASDYNFF
jgi:hypothetical protein